MTWADHGHRGRGVLRWTMDLFQSSERPIPAQAPQTELAMPSVDAIDQLHVVLMGRPGGDLGTPGHWLADLGAKVLWLPPDLVTLADLTEGLPQETRAPLTHALIDLEALGGIALACDALLALRNQRPDLAVILVSCEFQSNDFSVERLALCDASLRAPVVFSALEFAVSEARDVNNPQWIKRLTDLGPRA